jgi:hypothetical protein
MDIREHVNGLRARLAQCQATRDEVSAATHGELSASWISKFAAGRMRNPRVESLVALEAALVELECGTSKTSRAA